MFGSWKIAKLFGIDLLIHWSFWLLPLWVALWWDESQQGLPLWLGMILILCLFVCVVLHEFGHALMAQHFGIRTRSITLSPLGGLAQLERMSKAPWEEFCITVAGPLVNVAIAIVLGVGLTGIFAAQPALAATLPFEFVLKLLALNIFLVIFNMLPVFPMDGGRVFRAILAGSLGMLQGTRVAVGIGTVLAILMGAAGLFLLGNPFLFLIGLFVMFAGQQELQMLEAEDRRGREALSMTVALWDSQAGRWVRHEIRAAPRKRDSGIGV
jgi:Zn-dependent protease